MENWMPFANCPVIKLEKVLKDFAMKFSEIKEYSNVMNICKQSCSSVLEQFIKDYKRNTEFHTGNHILYVYICLCFTSLEQRGHLETAPQFTVPCEGCEGQ